MKWLSLCLVFCLAFVLPVSADMVTESSSTQNTVSSSSDDDDGIGTEVTLGLFVVVVAVLLWVGFRSDLAWFNSDKDAEPEPLTAESQPKFFVDLGELPQDSSTTLEEAEYDFAGRAGFQMKF